MFFTRTLLRAGISTSRSTASRNPRLRYYTASAVVLSIGLLSSHLPSIHGDEFAAFKHQHFYPKSSTHPHESLSSLVRAYAVYSLCSIPLLVDRSPQIFATLRNIPGVRELTDVVVRLTFFSQFVGGDTAEDTLPVLRRLRSENKGTALAYSVEADESSVYQKDVSAQLKHSDRPMHKRIVDEIIHCIDVAADFEDSLLDGITAQRKTWVAIKMTAILPDANALMALSSYIVKSRPSELSRAIVFPGYPTERDLDVLDSNQPARELSCLSQEDIIALADLRVDLVRICAHAEKRRVRLIVDAEHSWYQPAIDAFAYALMRQFNQLPSKADDKERNFQPLIYNTFQAYLRRTPAYLAQAIEDSKANHYALGVKLVRGAYHPHEIAAHNNSPSISTDPEPPVWSTKDATDNCYNACSRILLAAVKHDIQDAGRRRPRGGCAQPRIGVFFGTHNWKSCQLVLDELVASGLACESKVANDATDEVVVVLPDEVTERVTVGQLYGMSDALTEYLVGKTRSRSPFVTKYLPYGSLSEVMPYLSRRAIENKSVLGAGSAAAERRWAWAGIKKIFDWSR